MSPHPTHGHDGASADDSAEVSAALASLRDAAARPPFPAARPSGRRGERRSRASAAPASNALYSLRLTALWRFVLRQPASFWLVCIYIFFEYVRPQQIYEGLSIIPWGNIILTLAMITFVLEGNRIRFDLPEKLLLCFSGVLMMSSVAAMDPGVAFAGLPEWIAWIVVYVLIANTVTTESRFLVMVLSYLMWNFKMAQSGVRSWAGDGFAFRSWGISGAPGWFANSGEFAIQMCVFLPLVVAFWIALRRHWSLFWKLVFLGMAAGAVISVVGSSSRGGLIGLAAMALWVLAKSPYKVRGFAGVAIVALLVAFILPQEQLERLRASGDDDTSQSRITYWTRGLELMAERPLLGVGFENWQVWHVQAYNDKMLPHNIFIEAGAELGVTGLLAFVALIVGTLVVNARTRRIARRFGEAGRFALVTAHALDTAMIGYLATGLFVTVLYYPYFWINLAMTAALHNAVRSMAAAGSGGVVVRRRTAVA